MRLIDALLKRALAESEKKALGMILAGQVLVNDTPVTKPATPVSAQDTIRVRGIKKYVSRAGEKLAGALDAFMFPVENRSFIDIGASTGGFTDVLISRGAAYVAAVDVGKGLLHQKLRLNPRVEIFEGVDFKNFGAERLHQKPEAFVADVSFTSLNLIVEKAFSLLKPVHRKVEGVVLFKPQFELPKAERNLLDKGVLHNEKRLKQLLHDFETQMQSLNIIIQALIPAAIKGAKGNQEYVAHLTRP